MEKFGMIFEEYNRTPQRRLTIDNYGSLTIDVMTRSEGHLFSVKFNPGEVAQLIHELSQHKIIGTRYNG